MVGIATVDQLRLAGQPFASETQLLYHAQAGSVLGCDVYLETMQPQVAERVLDRGLGGLGREAFPPRRGADPVADPGTAPRPINAMKARDSEHGLVADVLDQELEGAPSRARQPRPSQIAPRVLPGVLRPGPGQEPNQLRQGLLDGFIQSAKVRAPGCPQTQAVRGELLFGGVFKREQSVSSRPASSGK